MLPTLPPGFFIFRAKVSFVRRHPCTLMPIEINNFLIATSSEQTKYTV